MAGHVVGGSQEGRPWRSPAYGLGLMTRAFANGAIVAGHSGSGPGSVIAVYHVVSSPLPRTVAAFSPGSDQGIVEEQCARLAIVGCGPGHAS